VASARVAHVARRAAEYGVVTDGPVQVDMRRVRRRKDEIVRRSTEGVEAWLRGTDNLTVHQGHARFIGPHQVQVGDEVLTAERIFINVGGRSARPPIPGLDEIPYWTSSDMMSVDFLPDHLVIVGGSYIGLEFAQMYRRFGSRVTVLQRDARLIPREDEEVSEAVKEILENEGIDVRVNATCIALERRGDRIAAASCPYSSARYRIFGSALPRRLLIKPFSSRLLKYANS